MCILDCTSTETTPLSTTVHSAGSTISTPPSAIAYTTSIENTSSKTQTIYSSSRSTINSELDTPVTTTKQHYKTSSNRFGTSTASATASYLPTKMSSSGTTMTLRNTDDEETDKQTTQEEGLSVVAICLIAAIVVASVVIFAIAGYILKQKISKK